MIIGNFSISTACTFIVGLITANIVAATLEHKKPKQYLSILSLSKKHGEPATSHKYPFGKNLAENVSVFINGHVTAFLKYKCCSVVFERLNSFFLLQLTK